MWVVWVDISIPSLALIVKRIMMRHAMSLASIRNVQDVLQGKALTTTNVYQGLLHCQGDYELVVFEIPLHTSQRPHCHRHGLIDIFLFRKGRLCCT